MPDERDYADAYCRRTGRDRIPHLGFYMAFNMFRYAAIIHGVTGRLARGNAVSSNATALVNSLPRLAAMARAEMEAAG